MKEKQALPSTPLLETGAYGPELESDAPVTGDGYASVPGFVRRLKIVILGGLILLCLNYGGAITELLQGYGVLSQSPADSDYVSSHGKVSLEAHIMSKCPDAKDCLRDLVVPAMANISDKVDFSLSYIGRTVHGDEEVECMHGQSECLGNIIELCAANLYPDPKIFLGFTNCMTMKYSSIPEKELVHDCALEHGLDFEKLNGCASKDDGAFGMDLLRNSVARSANAGVIKSCTVRLNGKIRCIRDGGAWKDCDGGSEPEDLIHDIEALRGDE